MSCIYVSLLSWRKQRKYLRNATAKAEAKHLKKKMFMRPHRSSVCVCVCVCVCVYLSTFSIHVPTYALPCLFVLVCHADVLSPLLTYHVLIFPRLVFVLQTSLFHAGALSSITTASHLAETDSLQCQSKQRWPDRNITAEAGPKG